MCEFCGCAECNLTKKEVLEHGAILENNTRSIMRDFCDTDEGFKYTYSFDGIPAYYSLSALIPDESEENPHVYMRFVFHEDTGCDGDCESREVQNPLTWQTEKEFLDKFLHR